MSAPADEAGSSVLPWRVPATALACGFSLAASLWALLDQGACAACEAVTLLSGGPVLPVAGVCWYGGLLLLLLRRGLRPPAALLVSAGAGVHLALVGYMLLRHELCAPCLAAAAGAFSMAALLSWPAVASARLYWPALGLAALLAGGALMAVNTQSSFRLQGELQHALAVARAAPAPPPGTALLVWFSRPGCERCMLFQEEVLPQLAEAYGTRLKLLEQTASSGLPTPTVVIRGRRETILYPNPSAAGLRRVIDSEIGP